MINFIAINMECTTVNMELVLQDIPIDEEVQEEFEEFKNQPPGHINEEGENLLILYAYHASSINP